MSSIKKDRSDYWAGRPAGYGPEMPTEDPSKRPGWFIRLRNRYPSIVYLFTPRIWNDPNHFLPTDVEQEIYFRRRKLKFALLAVLLLVGAIFLPERIRAGYERMQARNRSDEALTLLGKNDTAGAWEKAQRARTYRGAEPVVFRTHALAAAATGRWEEAVESWRSFAAAKAEFAPSDRLKRAEALAETGRFGAARTILQTLTPGTADKAAETLLAARISLGIGDPEAAAEPLAILFRDASLAAPVRLEVIRTIVESQRSDGPLRIEAERELVRLARQPGPMSAAAVELAARRAVSKQFPPDLLAPAELIRLLRSLPPGLERQLLAFDLEIQTDPARLADCIQDAQIAFNRHPARDSLLLISQWLLKHREWARVLTLLTPLKAKESPALALERISALMQSGQLRVAKLEITSQRYLLDPLTQQTLLAQIVAAAGDAPAAESRWNAAINLAGDDRLKLRQVLAAARAAGNEVMIKRVASLAEAAEAALQLSTP